jgi:exodeoxyribonuclease VII large subunit
MTLDLFATPDPAPPAAHRKTPVRPAAEVAPAPVSAERQVVSVAEVNAFARDLLETGIPPLWVAGEVSNFTRARSGHCYFTLKDDAAQVRCVLWRDDARRLPTEPAEGMEVRVLGQVTLYERRGDFQLAVRSVEAAGEGLWKLAVERLRERLTAEGLIDPARRRPLPPYPRCVGVVTSPHGAALRDIVSVIRRRAPWTDIVVSGCRVQGEGAGDEIVCALERLADRGGCDVVIVGRGGGSIEDLWAFNEEPVARAIAAHPVPVVSAVGHETDVTIADLVADLRAPTPSAAAEAVVPDVVEVRRALAGARERARRAVERRWSGIGDRVGRARRELSTAAHRRLARSGERVGSAAARLQALSPLGVLSRGYAIPLATDGSRLRSVDDFERGGAFDLRLADGTVSARTLDISPEEEA